MGSHGYGLWRNSHSEGWYESQRKRRKFCRQEMLALHEQGLNQSQIAERLGVSRRSISSGMKEMGVQVRRKLLLTPDQVAEIERRNEAGESIYSIARSMGRHPQVLRRALRKAKGKTIDHTPFIERVDHDEIEDLYLAGYSLEDLADKYKVSRQTIGRTLAALGGETRPSGGCKKQVTAHTLTRWIHLMGRGEDETVFDEMCQIIDDWAEKGGADAK